MTRSACVASLSRLHSAVADAQSLPAQQDKVDLEQVEMEDVWTLLQYVPAPHLLSFLRLLGMLRREGAAEIKWGKKRRRLVIGPFRPLGSTIRRRPPRRYRFHVPSSYRRTRHPAMIRNMADRMLTYPLSLPGARRRVSPTPRRTAAVASLAPTSSSPRRLRLSSSSFRESARRYRPDRDMERATDSHPRPFQLHVEPALVGHGGCRSRRHRAVER